MNLFKRITSFFLSVLLVISCNQKNENNNKKESTTQPPGQIFTDYSGNYVTDSYEKRGDGYDWISVKVNQTSKDEMNISVRSRADKKKPSCTFDAIAKRTDETTFLIQIEKSVVVFKFNEDVLSISTKEFDNRFILMYFCNGGASLMGDYRRGPEELDVTQIDDRPFSNMIEDGKIKEKGNRVYDNE